ncbi:MAG TPA: LLM class F420-dependent oxidoreductase [Anaerolineales bacterium]|nr:LLM class F420-dependent oxidoreductase [Anaerolineales bacterium]
MRIGIIYPQTEFGSDPIAIRDYAQTVEDSGFTHILAYDHVLGENAERPAQGYRPYTHFSAFQEPFVLFSYLAGFTRRIEFTTGILILPQRQTTLVAKQAATLDVLSQGRLRLGVGLGWNAVEYQALNEDFHNRGKRSEEQVEVLRRLWTEPLVSFHGKYHTIEDAGLNPQPVNGAIPIWFGGVADPVLKRAARLGDGWMPNYRTFEQAKPAIAAMQVYLEEAGRSPDSFGIEGRVLYTPEQPKAYLEAAANWERVGASHLSINTMGLGLNTPGQHLAAIQYIASELGLKS